MLGALWNLGCFAVAIGILVTVHEWGHFAAARVCRVTVERFSIGFGKVLWHFKDKKGTEYALSAIPLGGYVKMKGEGENGDREEGSFAALTVWRRIFIVAAGPACNILLAFLLYFIVNLNGQQVLRPVVGDVLAGSVAAEAGLDAGDEIVKVNDREVSTLAEALFALVENLGSAVTVEVRPFEAELEAQYAGYAPFIPEAPSERTLTLNLQEMTLGEGEDLLKKLGLTMMRGLAPNIVTLVQEGSPAARAGLQEGDRIEAVNGQLTPTWYAVQKEIATAGSEVELTVLRAGERYRAPVYPETQCDAKGQCRSLIGVGASLIPVSNLTFHRDFTVGEALGKAVTDTAAMSLLIARSTMMLLDGTISAANISGPISIARGAGQSAAVGLTFFISFLAAISVNLGILNLIPVPVLDGGQLLFLAYEALTGRAPSARVQTALTALGFGFLVTLSLFAIFNDLRAL